MLASRLAEISRCQQYVVLPDNVQFFLKHLIKIEVVSCFEEEKKKTP